MNINENNKFKLIDDYLKGGMNQDEIDSFKAFMQSDRDLAYDIAISKELEEASAFSSIETQLRDTLGTIRREDVGSGKGQNASANYFKIALVTIALTLLTFISYTYFSKVTPAATSGQQFAMVEPLELSTKSNTATTEIINMQASYNAGDYTTALPQINNYLKSNPRDLDVLLAKGIALTQTESYYQAQQVFALMASMKPRVQKHKWYSAVAYTKEGKTEQARMILTDIYNSKSYNHEQARKLMATFN